MNFLKKNVIQQINDKTNIWIICSLNFVLFLAVERIAEPSQVGTNFFQTLYICTYFFVIL